MDKIKIIIWNTPPTSRWSWVARIGERAELGNWFIDKDNPKGVGTSPNSALADLAVHYPEALGLKHTPSPEDYAGSCCFLGALLRANAEHFNLEIEAREG